MWDVPVCRSCLSLKGKLEKISENSKRIYTAITGIQIKYNDGYPIYFCLECRTHLRKTVEFSRKSRRAYYVMKEIMAVKKQVTYSDIMTLNRRKNRLETSLSYWKQQNSVCYMIKDTVDAMKVYKPSISNHFTCHIVDIQPTTVKERNEALNKDSPNIDEIKEITVQNVAMSDEKKDGSLLRAALVRHNVIANRKFAFNMFKDPIICARALCNADIKVLTLKEQISRFELRKTLEPFNSSLYKCAMCLTSHNNLDELLQHVAFHNSDMGRYMCLICKNKFSMPEQLLMHEHEAHLYEYQCKMCKIKTYSLYDLVMHNKREHPRSAVTNQELEASYEVTPLAHEDMYETVREHSRSSTGYECGYCSAVFRNSEEVTRHLARHDKPLDPKSVQCDICGVCRRHKADLSGHIRSWHYYSYTCKACDAVLYNRFQAIQHMQMHRKEAAKTEQGWLCSLCGEPFKLRATLLLHRYNMHYAALHRAHCVVCGIAFTKPYGLYKHQLVQHRYVCINGSYVSNPKFTCKKCDVQFVTEKAYQMHLMLMEHEEAQSIAGACLRCKRLFDSSAQFEAHEKSCRRYAPAAPAAPRVRRAKVESKCELEYVDKRPEPPECAGETTLCELCGDTVAMSALEEHAHSHWGGARVRLRCRHCGARFASATLHVLHVLFNHAHRPYHCSICGTTFKYKGDCRDHILKIHSPVKPYKCEHCTKQFSHVDFLHDHLLAVHKIDLKKNYKPPMRGLRRVVYLYPHMRIDARLLDKELLDQAQIELYDYLDKNCETLKDYKKYFIMAGSENDSGGVKRKSVDSGEVANKKMRRDKSDLDKVKFNKVVNTKSVYAKFNKEIAKMMNNVNNSYETDAVTDTEVMEAIKETDQTDVINDTDVTETNTEEVTLEIDGNVLDTDEPLEVIEQDGEQYVTIKGVLYKIERDE